MLDSVIESVLMGGQLVLQRLVTAWTTIPTMQDWAIAALLLGLYSGLSLSLGFKFKFLQVEPSLPWLQTAIVLLASVLSPGLSEELLYRVILLPHPLENPDLMTFWFWNSLSLVIFIVSHLVSAYTYFPAARLTFVRPIFLSLAGVLGLICAIAYQQSGSLWTPAVIHWLVVVIWLLRLGGYQKLYAR